MSLTLIIAVISGYFILLMTIARLTTRNSDAATFYTANKQSPWYLVAFGMIGATLSGVTFISLPGEVGTSQFSYFQFVLGYLPGYFVVGAILLPLYYRLKLITIYTYLEKRFGFWSHKTGAFYFLLSRIIGAAFRLFLVAGVLQLAIFNALGVSFWVTVMITIALIWLYTFQGGIKTIVFTDTLQTFFMLAAVIISIVLITGQLDLSFGEMVTTVQESNYSQIFFWDGSKNNFFKQFFAGMFMAIVMTGLDQDMMQKNLTCRSLKDAQKNMFWFSIVLVFVNLLFLCLGALLYIFSFENGIVTPERTDDLFPSLALNEFSLGAGIFFLLGLTAAAYSSADSALTSLTTTFCVDFLAIKPGEKKNEKKIRLWVHFGFSVLLFLVILLFQAINDESVITGLFTVAGYTYGPLLGLFAFGLFTKIPIKDKWVPWICLASPLLSYLLNLNAIDWFGYQFGFEILIVNGAITFLGLLILKTSGSRQPAN
ncbi:MAG: sodium:solute symporter [Bacteroidetes bacterium]|nr:MAG: sodium:solute symporter [Bacteroidota bacterium]